MIFDDDRAVDRLVAAIHADEAEHVTREVDFLEYSLDIHEQTMALRDQLMAAETVDPAYCTGLDGTGELFDELLEQLVVDANGLVRPLPFTYKLRKLDDFSEQCAPDTDMTPFHAVIDTVFPEDLPLTGLSAFDVELLTAIQCPEIAFYKYFEPRNQVLQGRLQPEVRLTLVAEAGGEYDDVDSHTLQLTLYLARFGVLSALQNTTAKTGIAPETQDMYASEAALAEDLLAMSLSVIDKRRRPQMLAAIEALRLPAKLAAHVLFNDIGNSEDLFDDD